MTRKEQIKKQADIYTDNASNFAKWSDDGGWSVTNDIDLIEKAFIEGAKWADEHPKSPWISVEDDLPYNHEELLNKDIRGFTKDVLTVRRQLIDCNIRSFGINHMSKYNTDRYHWVTSSFELVTHWMPIPELPKRIED